MSDRSFGMFMAFVVAVLVVIMSTPLTGVHLKGLTSNLLRLSSPHANQAPAVALAQN